MIGTIHTLLHSLGVTPTYRGYCQATDAILLALEDESSLSLITKLIYAPVAKKHGATFQCVERNITTIIQIAWRRNRPLLEDLVKISLPQPPTPSQFISALATHVRELEAKK